MCRKGLQSSFIIKTFNKVQSIWINLHVKYINTFQDINFPWLMKSFKHLTNSIICNNNIIWPRKALNIWPSVVLFIFMWSWLVCDILKHTYDRNIFKRTAILWQMETSTQRVVFIQADYCYLFAWMADKKSNQCNLCLDWVTIKMCCHKILVLLETFLSYVYFQTLRIIDLIDVIFHYHENSIPKYIWCSKLETLEN